MPIDDPPDLAISDTAVATESDAPAPRSSRGLTLTGYEVGGVIGKGGMGEVLLAHDPKIGRDVAIKRMHGADSTGDAVDRFLREAKIQARLDHPAIVPVHDLGRDAEGRPFFTMKRLTGTTLNQVMAQPTTSTQRLLRAFIDVCLAVEFAHARGVVHRDLKPSNIMLGEYGEVYVLDWGIARLTDDPTVPRPDTATRGGNTQTGSVLGTPGYMAPEQVRGEDVGPPADVYALGSILFEILAHEPLHPLAHAMTSTLALSDPFPTRRAPDRSIPPELDAACGAALARDPSIRPSARELGELVQRYLDGDRDLERRRILAADQLAEASATRDPVAALRLAGRALALDPKSGDAAGLVTKLMLAPLAEPPPALEDRLRSLDLAYSRRASRVAIYALLSFLSFVPIVLWAGLDAPVEGIATWGFIAGLSLFMYRFGGRGGRALYVVLVGVVTLAGLVARLYGPFIFTPGAIGLVAMGMMAQPDLLRRPWLVLGLALAAFLGPIALQAAGALSSTWSVDEGAIVSSSAVLHVGGAPTIVMLLGTNIAMIVVTGLFSRELASSRRDAQRAVAMHAWRLEQLVSVHASAPRLASKAEASRDPTK